VKFVLDTAIKVEPDENKVYCENGTYEYDHLIIATGPKVNFDIAPELKKMLATLVRLLEQCILVKN
jgi:sulfide:quinone oxidoreductase